MWTYPEKKLQIQEVILSEGCEGFSLNEHDKDDRLWAGRRPALCLHIAVLLVSL